MLADYLINTRTFSYRENDRIHHQAIENLANVKIRLYVSV